MNQRELNRSIAAATGESVNRIARLGFLLADPSEPIDDPHHAHPDAVPFHRRDCRHSHRGRRAPRPSSLVTKRITKP